MTKAPSKSPTATARPRPAARRRAPPPTFEAESAVAPGPAAEIALSPAAAIALVADGAVSSAPAIAAAEPGPTPIPPVAADPVAAPPVSIAAPPVPATPVVAVPHVAPPLPLHLPIPRPESYAAKAFAEVVDRATHAAVARLTQGLSPSALMLAYADWAVHLAASPGKAMTLVESALRKGAEFTRYAAECTAGIAGAEPCVEPSANDHRFTAPDWSKTPFALFAQGFLLTEQWWREATTGVRGVSAHHERVLEFAARQLLDTVAPSNFVLTNPEVLRATAEQGGANFQRGAANLRDEVAASLTRRSPEGEVYAPGVNLAVTPGKVVFRNRLIELIQYEPTAAAVRPEPVLIVPAWIMKYYILDLQPENSLVKFLVDRGHTVFMISWKNPDENDRDLSLEDYRKLGPEAALAVIGAIVPGAKVHAAGYCLGGTLMAIEAAGLARRGVDRLASLTLLAAQTDFHEAGELTLFIDESQLTFLEDMMWERGYLDTKQMAGAFQMLRSQDLVWSRMVREFLLGERSRPNDLMAWNADATRMPYRMHAEYLRKLFLDNDLAEGRYQVDGAAVAIEDIEVPIFAVGTETDHVAPWRSVHKITLIGDTEVTFVLTTGGHNAGIVSEPGHPRRSFRIATKGGSDPYQAPEEWGATAERRDGSWWLAWVDWLDARSGAPVAPPPTGAPEKGLAPLGAAPGSYVLQP